MDTDLEITIKNEGDITIIDLAGEVDAYTSSRFREVMLQAIEDGVPNLIVKMVNVEYIDSSGLGALVGGLKRVSEKNGKIVVVSDSPQVKKVFEITGLEKVFKLFDNEEAASKIFEAS